MTEVHEKSVCPRDYVAALIEAFHTPQNPESYFKDTVERLVLLGLSAAAQCKEGGNAAENPA